MEKFSAREEFISFMTGSSCSRKRDRPDDMFKRKLGVCLFVREKLQNSFSFKDGTKSEDSQG
jgi:hypothetical protein